MVVHTKGHARRTREFQNKLSKINNFGKANFNHVYGLVKAMTDVLEVTFCTDKYSDLRKPVENLVDYISCIPDGPRTDEHFMCVVNFSSILTIVLEEVIEREAMKETDIRRVATTNDGRLYEDTDTEVQGSGTVINNTGVGSGGSSRGTKRARRVSSKLTMFNDYDYGTEAKEQTREVVKKRKKISKPPASSYTTNTTEKSQLNSFGLEDEAIEPSSDENDGGESSDLNKSSVDEDEGYLSMRNKVNKIPSNEKNRLCKSLFESIECGLCKSIEKHSWSYQRHLQNCHQDVYKKNKYIFNCSGCEKEFRSADGSRSHIIRAYISKKNACLDNIRIISLEDQCKINDGATSSGAQSSEGALNAAPDSASEPAPDQTPEQGIPIVADQNDANIGEIIIVDDALNAAEPSDTVENAIPLIEESSKPSVSPPLNNDEDEIIDVLN